MDIATVIGLLAAFGLTVWGIVLGGSLSQFWDAPAVAIVLGGTGGALLVSYPLRKLMGLLPILRKAFFAAPEEPGEVIAKMVRYAERARRDITMCGYGPTAAAILASRALGATRAEILRYGDSGEAHAMQRVVGYLSAAIYRG